MYETVTEWLIADAYKRRDHSYIWFCKCKLILYQYVSLLVTQYEFKRVNICSIAFITLTRSLLSNRHFHVLAV